MPQAKPSEDESLQEEKSRTRTRKSAKNQREEPEHEGTSFITFTQEFGNQVAQEESDYEIHALVVNNVKEMEATTPRALQRLTTKRRTEGSGIPGHDLPTGSNEG